MWLIVRIGEGSRVPRPLASNQVRASSCQLHISLGVAENWMPWWPRPVATESSSDGVKVRSNEIG